MYNSLKLICTQIAGMLIIYVFHIATEAASKVVSSAAINRGTISSQKVSCNVYAIRLSV